MHVRNYENKEQRKVVLAVRCAHKRTVALEKDQGSNKCSEINILLRFSISKDKKVTRYKDPRPITQL